MCLWVSLTDVWAFHDTVRLSPLVPYHGEEGNRIHGGKITSICPSRESGGIILPPPPKFEEEGPPSPPEVRGIQVCHILYVGFESVVPVLVGRPDGRERQLELKLASPVDEVALLQLREQHKLAAPVRCGSTR